MTERGEILRPEDMAAFLADPAWFPHRVLDAGRTLQLVHFPRAEQRERSFLDERLVGDEIRRVELPIAAITDAPRMAPAQSCHYIFHSAFCCSTLLSRALDIDGVSIALKEPQAFNDLAGNLPKSGWPADQRQALGLVLDLMERPCLPDETAIIKPSNLANPLIEHMLELRPQSRALLMYAPLDDFLLAIARGRRWGWARRMLGVLRLHTEFETEQTRDLVLLTDFQVAAFLWLQQQAQFARLVRELPPGRVATLRSGVFLAEPASTIGAVAALFGLNLAGKESEAITTGTLFSDHAKRPGEKFDQSEVKRGEVLVKLAYGAEIERAIDWGRDIAAEMSIPLELPRPLVG